jgi:hypothetical protein
VLRRLIPDVTGRLRPPDGSLAGFAALLRVMAELHLPKAYTRAAQGFVNSDGRREPAFLRKAG